jgi:succinyl-CoA synthetase beta subunit
MIAEIKGLDRLLGEHRGRPELDRLELRRAVAGLSRIAAECPGIAMEINPLVVMHRGEGVFAIDVRVGA